MRNTADGLNPALEENQRLRHNLALIKSALREQSRSIAKIVPPVNNPTISLTTVEAATTVQTTRVWLVWHANGPYIVDTVVDGGWLVPSDITIVSIKLHRTTVGTSGTTSLDINKNGATMYEDNPSFKPTIDFSVTTTVATLPSPAFVFAGDILTLDIDGVEAGNPADLTVVIEGA